LDALSPVVLRNRLEQAILDRLDLAAWRRAEVTEAAERESLLSILSTWPGISGQASKYSPGRVSDDQVRADEITWTLSPIPRLVDADVPALDEADLLERVADLGDELASMRAVAVAAIAEIATLMRQADRRQEAHGRLIDELRMLRASTMRASIEARA
jgi:hypothetical protein